MSIWKEYDKDMNLGSHDEGTRCTRLSISEYSPSDGSGTRGVYELIL